MTPQITTAEVPDVYRAIADVMRAMSRDGIAKDGKNQQQGYAFRGIDAVFNALSLPMVQAGLCVLPRILTRAQTERETQKGGVLFYVVVEAEFDFVSVKDGSKHTVRMFGEAMDSADKATNKAMSAAYKYACFQTFVIPTEGMADADATTHDVKPTSQQAPPPPPDPVDDLATSIRKAFDNQLRKFIAAGKPQLFKQVLGQSGYLEIDEIPIDRDVANKLMNELKICYADNCVKNFKDAPKTVKA